MKKKIFAILLVLALVTLCIPAISGIPDEEPTEEEVKKIVRKQIEMQSGSRGWSWLSVSNRNPNPPDDNDISPEVKGREQYNLQNRYKTKYNIESSNSLFSDAWKDEFKLDDDTNWYDRGEFDRSGTLTNGGNPFWTDEYDAPSRGYWDMNAYIDVDDDIDTDHDSTTSNNHDAEYMYFWYI